MWQNAQPETFLHEEMILIGMWAGHDKRGHRKTGTLREGQPDSQVEVA